jgi:Fe-S-cluster containining protein
MVDSGADSSQSTATLRLTMGELRVVHPITVTATAVPATAVIPALQKLVNAVVDAAERKSVEDGRAISCRKGCGACCRQAVPISHTEGDRLLDLIEAMPASRRDTLTARFAAASEALMHAGLREALLAPDKRDGKTNRDLSLAYWALGIACPFLEAESCSIHAERPLTCREYLATSPAELCAGPAQEGVKLVAVPKASMAARGLDEDNADADTSGRWFALSLLLDWSKARPREAVRRPGPEWVQRFVRRIGR